MKDKNQIIALLSGMNEQYQKNIVSLKEANKEFSEINGVFLSKKKFFEENGFPNLTSEQKYEMTGKQIDEYNEKREKIYGEYEKKYKTSYNEFLKQKNILDLEKIVNDIINDKEVLNENQKEIFFKILDYTDGEKDFTIKTTILKSVLELITGNYSVKKENSQEKTGE